MLSGFLSFRSVYDKDSSKCSCLIFFQIRAEIEEKYTKFLADGTKEQLDEINKFQREFKCCGFAGPGDFPKGKVPESCTGITKGCADAFMETITSVGSPLFIAAIVTLIVLVCLLRD